MTNQTQPTERNRRRWILSILGSILGLLLLYGISTWGVGQSAKAQLAAQYPVPGQLVDVGGYKLHLNCVGEGSPLVIMDAGNNDFSVTWASVQPEIAQFTKVCSYDRAILSTTDYFETAVSETASISDSFAEVREANITNLGNTPLIVLSRVLPDPIPGASETDNQAFEETWQILQSELIGLSTNSKQIIAEESDHYIQLRQPQLVIDAIYELVQAEQISLD